MKGIAQLRGTVRYYDWGGYVFIPDLLQIENPAHRPFAECWFGVHPQATSTLIWPGGEQQSLLEYIQSDKKLLGEATARRFGNMPYLLKLLDVKDMLSIQVHPSKEAAVQDYAKENAAGIPADAPHRNYKDDNHKPELMVAMGEFWLLHGFKPVAELKKTLGEVPELNNLLPVFGEEGDYKELYRYVMEMPQQQVNQQLKPLLDRILPQYQAGQLNRSSADFWAARAALTFNHEGITDRGIFSVYLFNLVHLQKGQAIFQDAGVPHAYLEGQNVEIMASSDNVLRGGLTTKHIDVPELLKHTRCEPTEVKILDGEKEGALLRYRTPAPDFELSKITLGKDDSITLESDTAEIFLLTEGSVSLSDGKNTVELRKGELAAAAFAGQKTTIRALESAVVFRAGVPAN
ncbi:MAG: mannose-6-phosphate isomerase, class I [Terrimonas ferruginea]|uniref:mannose-6-phosphate isomerase, class I n=1 Tax=Terrimonas ferruginea TaxID=249 RepID=UPI000929FE2F|nr:mannose-6-phosphate isomerase, class I [Terrimonas ferruginea]MBN8783930.1 mannose-6-phosphate isomerase, class I [Terrimonas ferruginea]OJW41759.1 MAG: mannose-6-phosphate isomerase, class I [Sphingobacteriales bacterium 48-107]